MTLKQQLGKLRWKNFLFLTIAGMVNAFGVTMFIAPVDLYDSGISGTSILLSQLTPEWLSLSLFLLVLNIPLFLYGLRKQGVVFTIFSVCAVSSHFLRFSFFSLLPYLYQIPSVFRHSGKYVIHFLTQIARSHTQRRLPHSTL